ncbi:MAG: D-alanyl-D-alanine carboxypeptidase [Clostridioides sp.]|nr:D-alanyl-D-alanine carboxypeptidase [Clostridioides sp.]
MKFLKKITCLLLAILVSLTPMHFSYANEGDSNKVNGKLDLVSKSAILMDKGTGKVLYEKNANEKLPPASVTKVMTMLLISEAIDGGKLKLTDKVQVSEKAASMGGSQIFLEAGEIQTVDSMLKGIAVSSANDACVAMAEQIGGSVDGFVEMMNARAKELGMKNTNFVNTNGLPVENHYTSANDIALMSRELLKHDVIHKYLTTWMDKVVVGKKKAEVGLANTNKLIRHYQGATGVKTGFTSEAKYCVSASAKRGNTELIAVVLAAPSSTERNKDAASLLDYGFANYESIKIADKGSNVGKVNVDKADTEAVKLVVKDDLTALIKKGESKNFKKYIAVKKKPALPIKAGTVLGKLVIKKGNEVVGNVDLINVKDVNKASYVQMLQRVIENMI